MLLPKNPNKLVQGYTHAREQSVCVLRGVGMPCWGPRSQIPIPLLISDSPLRHSFAESRECLRMMSCTPRVKIIIWLSQVSLTAGLESPGTATYWQNLKPHVTDLA